MTDGRRRKGGQDDEASGLLQRVAEPAKRETTLLADE